MEYDIEKDYCGTLFEVTRYYKKGANIYHREDGPAIIWSNGPKEWWVNGKLHRLDGPAFIYHNSKEWWINGKRLSKEKEHTLNRWWDNKNGV